MIEMSYSTLYGIDENGKGHVLKEYKNSWLFSPTVWELLNEKFNSGGFFMHGLEKLEEKIDDLASDDFERHIWEMTMQRCFFTQGKQFILNSIEMFINRYTNFSYKNSYMTKAKTFDSECFDRFREIAKDIEGIDVDKYPYFIFKNTSLDDQVENLFSGRNEQGERIAKTLYDDNNDCWFVLFDENGISDYSLFRELEDD